MLAGRMDRYSVHIVHHTRTLQSSQRVDTGTLAGCYGPYPPDPGNNFRVKQSKMFVFTIFSVAVVRRHDHGNLKTKGFSGLMIARDETS